MVGLALPFAYLHARSGGVSLKVFVGIMLGISFVLLNNVFRPPRPARQLDAVDRRRGAGRALPAAVARRLQLAGALRRDDAMAVTRASCSSRTARATRAGPSRSRRSRARMRGARRRRSRSTCAFLEMMTPDLADAGRRAGRGGATRIDVVPLFLGAGGHLRKDLPPLVDELRAARIPASTSRLHPAVGENAAVIDAHGRAPHSRSPAFGE